MVRLGLVILFVSFANGLFAADLKLKTADNSPPKQIDSSIQKLLQPKSIQLLDGDKPAFEFWFISNLPLQSKSASFAKALDTIKPATLLGVVSVPKSMRDYRDDEIAPGVYTMRFTLQPQDGNHLGTADFLYFVALTPAKLDPKPDAITDYKSLVKASSKETSTDHPVVMSLRPVNSESGEFPKIEEPAPEHKSVRVKLPATAGAEKTSIIFDIVFEGKAHK